MIKLRILGIYERFQFNVLGPLYRRLGKKLYKLGLGLQGSLASDDRLVPSLRSLSHKNVSPSLQNADFVAPNSAIVGDVSLGSHSSIWYGASIRGDLGSISIGNNTLLQDLVSVVSRDKKSVAKIGNNVVVAPNSLLESCTIEDNSFVGMGSTVRQGAKIESYGVLAAGAVLKENSTIPSNQIWAGNPARYLRDISPEEREALNEHHIELVQLARIHAEECEKSFREILDDLDKKEEELLYEPEELALKEMIKLGFPVEPEDEELIEQRIFNEPGRHQSEPEYRDIKTNDPYEQDLFKFPDQFKIYEENYEKFEKAKKYFDENPNVEAKLNDRMAEGKERIPVSEDHSWKDKY